MKGQGNSFATPREVSPSRIINLCASPAPSCLRYPSVVNAACRISDAADRQRAARRPLARPRAACRPPGALAPGAATAGPFDYPARRSGGSADLDARGGGGPRRRRSHAHPGARARRGLDGERSARVPAGPGRAGSGRVDRGHGQAPRPGALSTRLSVRGRERGPRPAAHRRPSRPTPRGQAGRRPAGGAWRRLCAHLRAGRHAALRALLGPPPLPSARLRALRAGRARGGTLARPDLKQGFCLTDNDRVQGVPDPPPRVYDVGHRDTDCGRNRPGARYLEEGISVAWTDVYSPHLEGQQIEVTGLAAGTYDLVHTANPEGRLRERGHRNNTASVRLRLSWPRGRRAEPRVRVLARCPARPRCAKRAR